ncbi:alpha/beta fold hydrolase [Nocardioides litoris]|uniref:alpha/beta fold hydrolase n=1 Tax=Nocardioides litoris TaxID=1926648 RepID=UPI001FE34275|nr:alpha/beta hydrolase [Nocardioides litoris]
MSVSEELFAPVSGDIELCYQTFGDPEDEPLLLVMGLGGPMTWWDAPLCEMLAREGFHVIRFDNRDVGRSSRARGRVSRSMLVRGFTGMRVTPPYTLDDLARDAFGLLDHLGIASAHVAGVSMGGMVVQCMALLEPGRVRSMASIMSTTGRRTVGWQHPVLLRNLLTASQGREGYIRSSTATWGLIGSPAYPQTKEKVEKRAADTYDRGVSLSGTTRQMAAIVTTADRTPGLRALDVPTVVVHGLADKMVHVSGGRATATAIPGAELLLVEGMGHDMPEPLWPTFVEAITGNARRA